MGFNRGTDSYAFREKNVEIPLVTFELRYNIFIINSNITDDTQKMLFFSDQIFTAISEMLQ